MPEKLQSEIDIIEEEKNINLGNSLDTYLNTTCKKSSLENSIFENLHNLDDKLNMIRFLVTTITKEQEEIQKKLNFNDSRLKLLENLNDDLVVLYDSLDNSFDEYTDDYETFINKSQFHKELYKSCNNKTNN